jgi:hypothetical protein
MAQGFRNAADQRSVLARDRIADCVGNIHRAGSSRDHRARYFFQEVRIGAGAVFGRELHVVYMTAGQFHCGYGLFQHLLLRLLQLVFEVDLAGGDEGVDARALGMLQRGCRPLHIQSAAARQGRYLCPGELAAYGADRLVVAFGGDREPGFQNVHSEFDKLTRHAQLFRYRHAAARRLLPVTQRGVEDIYALAHK